jgi:predicted anti-sigma-YlaC factor YlaD
MRVCDQYSATIQLYFDQELDGPNVEDVRAHLQECAGCQAQFEADASLSHLLRRFRPLYFAPNGLRGRVASSLL